MQLTNSYILSPNVVANSGRPLYAAASGPPAVSRSARSLHTTIH